MYSKDVLRVFGSCGIVSMVHELRFSVPKKLSTQALSQELPMRLMLGVMPCVVSICWFCHAAY